ncbi:MAG: hypothetical protein ABJ333_05375, partial [Algoriphagus sp.]
MNRILLVAGCFFLIVMPFFFAHAQGGYVEEQVWSNVNPDSRQAEDFVILNNGQKLFGKVVRAYDFSNYDQVDFQYQGNLKTYFPSDLQAFGLDNGRFFMSKMLPGSSVIEFVQVLFSGSLQLD